VCHRHCRIVVPITDRTRSLFYEENKGISTHLVVGKVKTLSDRSLTYCTGHVDSSRSSQTNDGACGFTGSRLYRRWPSVLSRCSIQTSYPFRCVRMLWLCHATRTSQPYSRFSARTTATDSRSRLTRYGIFRPFALVTAAKVSLHHGGR
jgi:hypothetical protein